jgi:mannosyl-oligosaccharide alpha-1,2-mannosidase
VPADVPRQTAIRDAFLHQWRNYEAHCFGADNFRPISLKCDNSELGGGLTIIDSISTMIVMNLTAEYEKAKEFVAHQFHPSGRWSLFEFIIRYLGGLLSAAELTDEQVFKDAAIAVGYAILPVIEDTDGFFETDFTLEWDRIKHFSAKGKRSSDFSLAESGTFQVEFFTLAKLTGDARFVAAAAKVYRRLWRNRRSEGLISPGIGAGDDSYYEYVIKSYITTGGISEKILHRYLLIARDIKRKLVFHTHERNLTGIGVNATGRVIPMMEHLATFAGGMFAIGTVKRNPHALDELALADELARTYWMLYAGFPAGVMPERVVFRLGEQKGAEFTMAADGYILRPESVESVYLMWKFTGLQKYRDYAWEMFKGINRSCFTENGYTSIRGIGDTKPMHVDATESFFLAETLKYLYLTFSDSLMLSPAEWVFNTEAHPMRIWDDATIQKFRHMLQFEDVEATPV